MVNSITIINSDSRYTYLYPSDPWDTGLVVAGINGLTPVKGTINTSEISSGDGASFNSARLTYRNIVLDLNIVPIYDSENVNRIIRTVEGVRNDFYRKVPVKDRVEVRIRTDSKVVETYGYVESNEIEIFSQEETAQISIICPDPFFYMVLPSKIISVADRLMSSYSSNFISNFDAIKDWSTIMKFPITGRSDQETSLRRVSDSEVKTGAFIIIEFVTDNITSVTLSNSHGDGITVDAAKALNAFNGQNNTSYDTNGFKTNDAIMISTFLDKHYIKMQRGSYSANILAAVPKDTKWFYMYPSSNTVSIKTEGGSTNPTCNCAIYYTCAYEGV